MSAPSVRPLWSVTSRVRPHLAAMLLASALRAITALAAPALVAAAVDATLGGRDSTPSIIALGVVLVGGGLAELAIGVIAAAGSGRGTVWLRTHTARHLLGTGTRSELAPGDAVTRVVHATAESATAPFAVAGAVINLLGAAGGLVMLWVIDWRVGLAFSVVLPPAVVLTRRFVSGVSDVQARYLAAQAVLAGGLLGALTGLRTIRATGTAAVEAERVLRGAGELSAAGRALWTVQRRMIWRLRLLLPISEIAVLTVAGAALAGGEIGAGDLLAVSGYVAVAAGAFGTIDSVLGIGQSKASAERVATVLAVPAPDAGELSPAEWTGTLRFAGVRVHRGGQPVLDGVELSVPAGSALAVVGRSGSGKTTLAELVGRLRDPDAGEVLLDGIPVRSLSFPALRAAVRYAFDTPVLLGDTVGEAIGYGRDDVDIRGAAVAARADGFIARLPDGYRTKLADAPMSGGELQRVGLARAMAADAAVYVLDDATSGLDTVTESEVRAAIFERLAGRTRLIVAHRESTAAACELVAWLDGGRVRALAPHAELCADPEYRAVFAGQSDGQSDGQSGPQELVEER